MPKRKRKSKTRADGEGTIYKRSVKRKDGSIYYRWEAKLSTGYINGERKRKTVYGKTQAEVARKLQELRNRFANGTLSISDTILKDYMRKWLADKARQVKSRTHELYSGWTEKHIIPQLGNLKVDNITPLNIQSLIHHVADTVGVSTANKVRRVLYGALKQAVRWRLIPYNPVEAVDPLKENTKAWTLWTAEEVVRFLDKARASRYYAAYYLLITTGLRRGEVLGLMWSDLKNNQIYVQRSYTRTNKGLTWTEPKTERGKRFVTLAADTLQILAEHRERQAHEKAQADAFLETDVMFTTPEGSPVSPQSLQTDWKRLQEEAGVRSIRIHDLRHLHVSLLVKQGFDPRTVADRVGHTDPAFTLRRYSHMFEEQRQAAAINLAELLGSKVQNEALN